MAHATAQHARRVAAQLRRLEGAAYDAHRAYLDHLQACPCCEYGQTRCSAAEALWTAYTHARGGAR
ncbi:hypothetical protein PV703_06405 [Streptomyces sp. ME01-24h]|nr:hypothetical protein [Streptomyces sp. ME01-24h]